MKDAADAILRPEQAAYLASLPRKTDPLLEKMEAYAASHRHPISDPEVADLLFVTARAAGAKRVVEVGTNIGYGAIVLARAVGPDGHVLTIEYKAETCEVARGFIAEAGLSDRIDVRHGDAIEVLGALEGEVDLAYVDCVKEDYPRYLDLLLPRLSARGVLLADNVLWKGLVAADAVPDAERERVTALRAFNAAIVSRPELRGVVLPIGDGVGYAVRA